MPMEQGEKGKRQRGGVIVGGCGCGKILSRSLGGREIKCGFLAIDRVAEPIIIKSQYAVGVIPSPSLFYVCVCVCVKKGCT